MTAADFRRIALSFEGVEEGSHMGAVDFRVGGHIFATLASVGRGFGNLMLTSEIRDAETAEQAIQGGESGCLMLATMHGRSTVGTLRKILSYTGSHAPAMRSVLAGSLIAVVRQALIPSAKGDRYHMVADVLFNAGKVTQSIEAGDWCALEHAIHSENLGAHEYISMNARIVELVKRGEVDAAAAMRATSDMFELRRKLSR